MSVVYALPDEQVLVQIPFVAGMTAQDAFERANLTKQFPEIADTEVTLGAYGRPIARDQLLTPGTRVEILRPLQRDPREARRIMMSLGLVMGQRER